MPAAAEERLLDVPSRAALPLVAAALWLLFAFNLGSLPLTDPDEGRYAEIAREMLGGGDWIVPHLFGIPYLEKPPLLYWLTALSFEAFGKNEFAARLAPTLAALVGVLAVGRFAAGVFGARAALWASVVLGTSALYVVLARALVTDMLFSTGISVALLSFLSAREQRDGRAFALAWVGLAIAVLSKGPAAIVLCALIVFADSISSRSPVSWRWLRSFGLWLTLPIFLLLATPWFAIVQARHPEFFSFYLWKEHLNRAAGSEHAHSFLWYVPILLAGLLPWTPFAIAALPAWYREARSDSSDGAVVRFLLLWATVVFVVFSASVGKLATYILPMFVPLALLVGRRLADRGGRTPVAISTAAALVYVAATFAAPWITEPYTAHSQIAELRERLGADDEVAMFGGYFPSVAFYLERSPLLVGVRQELRLGKSLQASDIFVTDLPQLREAAPKGRLYCLTDAREKRADELRGALGGVELISRNQAAALWVRSGDAPRINGR